MEEDVSLCRESIYLLVCVSYFTVKSQLMHWSTGEYCRMACFPHLKSCYVKRNDQMLCFNKTMLLPKLQRQPSSENKSIRLMVWPRSESRFEPYCIVNSWTHIKLKRTGRHFSTTHKLFELSATTLTLFRVKRCLQVGEGYFVLSYVIYSICAILANFLTSDL